MEDIIKAITSSDSIVLLTIIVLGVIGIKVILPVYKEKRTVDIEQDKVLAELVKNNTEAMVTLRFILEDIKIRNGEHVNISSKQFGGIQADLTSAGDKLDKYHSLVLKRYDELLEAVSEIKTIVTELKIKQDCKEK